MELSGQQAWAVDRLLLQREALFVQVAALEAAVEARLGAPYPFPEPPPLPSRAVLAGTTIPGKAGAVGAGAAKKGGGGVKRKGGGGQLRALGPGEVAYEVRFRQPQGVLKERHQDQGLLERLLREPTLGRRVVQVAVVLADGSLGPVLWVPAA